MTARRLTLAVAAVAVSAVGGASEARAGLLELTAQIHGGYMVGEGLSGADYENAAFHEGATGPTYGFLVGAEVFFVDFWIEHDQYVDDSSIAGTWTQFMLGMDLEYEFTESGIRRVQTQDESGQAKVKQQRYSRKSGGYIELGGAFGFAVGTGLQVELPLDNAQVTDKGFVLQASIGGGWRLNSLLSFGVSVPVQTGFLFKSGNGTGLIENEQTRYQEGSVSLLANLRLRVDLL